MLLVTDNQEMAAWHFAATSGHSGTLQNLWQFAKQTLTTENLNKLLLGTENQGMTAWHLAATSDNSETLNKLWH